MDYFVVFASFVVKRRAFRLTTKITKDTQDEECCCLLRLDWLRRELSRTELAEVLKPPAWGVV